MQGTNVANASGVDTRRALRQGLSQVIRALQSEDAVTRARALELFRTTLLPESQERLVEMLVAALDSAAEAKRRAAVGTLTAIGLPAVLLLSLRYIRSRKAARRRQAVEVLGAICLAHPLPPGYVLARALQDRDPDVRRAAEEAWRALRCDRPGHPATALE